MKVSIFPENGQWLLVLNRIEPDHDRYHVDATPLNSFEKCWTGKGWSDAPADGQRFALKDHALVYLDRNWQRMEAATEQHSMPSVRR